MSAHIDITLPHGTRLHCHTAGERGRPVLLFLHGFPEGAFIWDGLLDHFAQPAHGGYRCVAPYLRGFGASSSPTDVAAYRPKFLVQDLAALIAAECGEGAPLECLVAHDWGGAVAWNLANQHPQLVHRLAIVNSPHPGAFVRELQHRLPASTCTSCAARMPRRCWPRTISAACSPFSTPRTARRLPG
jgi:pimeloyl-ACP methyl ester carboxylesterase